MTFSFRKTTHHLLTISGILLFTACGESEPPAQGGGFPTPMVSVAEVIVKTVTPWAQVNGQIVAKEIVEIQPRVGGVINKVSFKEGESVKKGDLLYVLDQQPFKTELSGAKANLSRAQAQASLAVSEVTRAKDLVKRNLLSPEKYDQLLATENQAHANVESAKASVKLAELNLAYTKIRSPIDGQIGQTLISQGNLVSSTPTPDHLTTIFSLDPIYVMFGVDEMNYLKHIKTIKKFTQEKSDQKPIIQFGLSHEKDYPYEGHIDFISSQVNADTGTVLIRAVLDNKNRDLIPGLFAKVKVPISDPVEALLISDHAVLTDQDRRYVYVLNDKNQALRRDVKLGGQFDGLRMITEGLSAGEQIVVHGIQKVFFPGMEVKPQVIVMGEMPIAAAPKPPSAEH